MKKILFSLLILFSITGIGFAQEVTIQVIENEGEPKYISLNKPDNNLTDQELLLVYYANKGFFEAEVHLKENRFFTVITGEQYKISSLLFYKGIDTIYTDEDLKGELFSSEMVEKRIDLEYAKTVNEGYLDAKISIKGITVDSLTKTVSVMIINEKGSLIKVNDILFTGTKINSQRYLTRISGFRDSLAASQENLNQIRRNLKSSELIEDVSEPIVYKDNGDYKILVQVNEQNLNQLDGLIGYVPDQSGKGQIVGDLDVSLWNVLREGNAFELQYQRLKPETSRLKLMSSQDWIANVPFRLGLDFSLYQNDTTYQTRNIGLNASYHINPDFSIKSRIYSLNSSSANESLFSKEPDGTKQGGDLGFSYIKLDRREVPTSGFTLDVIYGVANKDIKSDSSLAFRQQRLETNVKAYFRLFDNSVIATSVNGFYVVGEKFTESDLIRFGGANSLRGYSEEQFTASELLWGDIEYRFLTDRYSYLFLFAATGFYQRPQLYSESDASFFQRDFLYSGGFGLSFRTTIGRLKFTYALSSTETLGNGKVHFGIRTSL